MKLMCSMMVVSISDLLSMLDSPVTATPTARASLPRAKKKCCCMPSWVMTAMPSVSMGTGATGGVVMNA